jgi:hypothetical protein
MTNAAAFLLNGAAYRSAPSAFSETCITPLQCCWHSVAECFDCRLAPTIALSPSSGSRAGSGIGRRLFEDCCTIPMAQSIASTPLDLKILRMRVA